MTLITVELGGMNIRFVAMLVSPVLVEFLLSDFTFVTKVALKSMGLFLMDIPFTLVIEAVRADVALGLAVLVLQEVN